MLKGLNILDRTITTFDKHSKELIAKAREVNPANMQKRLNIRQVFAIVLDVGPSSSSANHPCSYLTLFLAYTCT